MYIYILYCISSIFRSEIMYIYVYLHVKNIHTNPNPKYTIAVEGGGDSKIKNSFLQK